MPRWPVDNQSDNDQSPDSDWDLGEGLDPDGPSAADLDRFGNELSVCPACDQSIYDQVPICPNCGHAFEEKPRSLSLWTVAGVAGLIVLLLIFAF
jgi:uncharacterized paraquat-inducible protein A